MDPDSSCARYLALRFFTVSTSDRSKQVSQVYGVRVANGNSGWLRNTRRTIPNLAAKNANSYDYRVLTPTSN